MMPNQKLLNKRSFKEEKFQKTGKDFIKKPNLRLKMIRLTDGTLPLALWEIEQKI